MLNISQWFTPSNVYWAILFTLIADFLFQEFLHFTQYRVLVGTKEIPSQVKDNITKEQFEKSRAYGLDRLFLRMFSIFYHLCFTIAYFTCGLAYTEWWISEKMANVFGHGWEKYIQKEIGVSICYVMLVSTLTMIIDLPISIFSTFKIEEKYGFNKMSFGFYLKELVKNQTIGLVITIVFVTCFLKIALIGGSYTFVWLWMFFLSFTFGMMIIYPILIAPIFDTFTPLREGTLKKRIEELAARVNFPVTAIYVVDGSKKSSHSNAYIIGFLNIKRIVLYDTLIQGYSSQSKKETEKKASSPLDSKSVKSVKSRMIEGEERKNSEKTEKGCTEDEILAVMAHELGHWKHSHIMKDMLFLAVVSFITFTLVNLLYQNETVFKIFGFPEKYPTKPILIGMLVVFSYCLKIYNTALHFITNLFSRYMEYQADEYCVEMGFGKEGKMALVKLNKDNLSFPVSSYLYSIWHEGHPNLLQRLEALDKAMEKSSSSPSSSIKN